MDRHRGRRWGRQAHGGRRPHAGRTGCRWAIGVLLLSSVGACGGDGTTRPGSVRFGQLGEVRASVVAPLIVVNGTDVRVEGEIQQTLTWNASGPWQLYESVSYRGRIGDETVVRSQGDPSQFASAYASLITQFSDTEQLQLVIPGLDPDLEVDCLADGVQSRSRVTFQIRDEIRDEVRRWTRCADGSLEELATEGAGPDDEASRVVQAICWPGTSLSARAISPPISVRCLSARWPRAKTAKRASRPRSSSVG